MIITVGESYTIATDPGSRFTVLYLTGATAHVERDDGMRTSVPADQLQDLTRYGTTR